MTLSGFSVQMDAVMFAQNQPLQPLGNQPLQPLGNQPPQLLENQQLQLLENQQLQLLRKRLLLPEKPQVYLENNLTH